ncbi:uncharacterized protein YndB with AHSA1/START domain [Mycobacterium sp. OAS707]|uniref:SRPBCC family protein n=1 Tax=Mycobacterium sp. OAS707 TaxID=2663822 RepID=UPI0017894CF5|nr:SRPBCC family protein [Mycobacterium sp. OAS707]MBE1546970.1 uncharacterized protein YndB with AHSA1/START domain [Mycobacterium sp. OAS707]
MSMDRIEKDVVLRASLARVWQAISNADEFGQWFGVRLDGPFTEGASVTGVITPTTVDEDVARRQQEHAGKTDTWQIVAIEPQRRLAFRWHPYPGEADGSEQPTTLVEFTLAETEGGVLLRIVESGFDQIPAEHRASAFEGNSEGWAKQTELVSKYLALSEKV